MQIESGPRARRAFLAAALGAGLASVVAAIRPPESVRAADPNDVVLGALNTSATTTTVANSTTGSTQTGLTGVSSRGTGLLGASAAAVPNAKPEIGVFGYSVYGEESIGVYGESSQGTGVHGYAINGTGTYGQGQTGVHGKGFVGVLGESVINAGVEGSSVNSAGVYGHSEDRIGVVGAGPIAGVSASSEQVGVFATSLASQSHPALIGNGKFAGPGVAGFSGTGQDETNQLPSVPDRTGVYGHAAQTSAAAGVVGETTIGSGVVGRATTGIGIVATATSGTALKATSDQGFALRTSGRIKLEKSAGVATIAAGTRDILVSPGIDLTGASAVIATLNGFPGGTTTVQRVLIYTVSNQFRIYLTANTTASVQVAWLVLG